jgi:hypothetical protein
MEEGLYGGAGVTIGVLSGAADEATLRGAGADVVLEVFLMCRNPLFLRELFSAQLK